MIKGCPGRYIIKHKRTNPVLVGGTPVTALGAKAFLTAALGHTQGMVVHDLVSERCVDGVQVVVFADSGGVITYCKQEESVSDGDVSSATVYVHTLNTASGLQRKLEGLRLDHVLEASPPPMATAMSLTG
jgi:hypothetical protein